MTDSMSRAQEARECLTRRFLVLSVATVVEGLAWVRVGAARTLEGLAMMPIVYGGWLVILVTIGLLLRGEARDAREAREAGGLGVAHGPVYLGIVVVVAINVLFAALFAK